MKGYKKKLYMGLFMVFGGINGLLAIICGSFILALLILHLYLVVSIFLWYLLIYHWLEGEDEE